MSEKIEEVDDVGQINKNEEPNGGPTCEIYFENSPNRVYYVGQVLNGSVHLAINDPITVRAIYANIVGQGHCQWTTSSTRSSGSNRRTTILNHMKDEFYINKKIYYVGTQNISGRGMVQSGEYKYFFSCDIPDGCHTSIEENTGFIRYTVTLVIEEDDNVKKEFVESFTVINPFNLNDDITYSYPMSDETELVFTKYCCCLCCCLTEPVKISVKIPMKGYAPGQAIEITINVDNKSNQTYDNFIANMYKKIEFYANERTSNSKEMITTAKCEGCPAGESLSRKLIITVPPTPRTEISNICSISYELTVGAFSDCCQEDPSFLFPLTIGTYPIEQSNTQTSGIVITQQPSAVLGNEQDFKQFHSKIANEPLLSQPLLNTENMSTKQYSVSGSSKAAQSTIIDPPDYKPGESTRSDKDLEKSYRPLYPVYRNNQLASSLNVEVAEVKPIKI